MAARFTGRQFLVDPRVTGKMTVVSDGPVSRTQAYQLLLGALRMRGFAVVENGGVSRVVPQAELDADAVLRKIDATDSSFWAARQASTKACACRDTFSGVSPGRYSAEPRPKPLAPAEVHDMQRWFGLTPHVRCLFSQQNLSPYAGRDKL